MLYVIPDTHLGHENIKKYCNRPDNFEKIIENEIIGKNDTLSGGERRKISIKKAFSKSADLLIFDEPDNNLDNSGIAELLQNILSDKNNKIIVLISHDERIFNIADKIICLKQKKLMKSTQLVV